MLAVDPSSPFTGGAILGDRVRMQDHATDPGVFIRSMATRGHLGGLSLATPEAIRLLDAVGHRWIVIETVGVGQVEVEIAGKADTTVVVVNPGWGDTVQANKAGLMEIADVFVINKADRPGVDGTRRDLEQMLELARDGAPARRLGARRSSRRSPPSTGIAELWDAVVATAATSRPRAYSSGGVRFRLGEELREIVARRLERAPGSWPPATAGTSSAAGRRAHDRPVDRGRRDARRRR